MERRGVRLVFFKGPKTSWMKRIWQYACRAERAGSCSRRDFEVFSTACCFSKRSSCSARFQDVVLYVDMLPCRHMWECYQVMSTGSSFKTRLSLRSVQAAGGKCQSPHIRERRFPPYGHGKRANQRERDARLSRGKHGSFPRVVSVISKDTRQVTRKVESISYRTGNGEGEASSGLPEVLEEDFAQ